MFLVRCASISLGSTQFIARSFPTSMHDFVWDVLFNICMPMKVSMKKEVYVNFLIDLWEERLTFMPIDILV